MGHGTVPPSGGDTLHSLERCHPTATNWTGLAAVALVVATLPAACNNAPVEPDPCLDPAAVPLSFSVAFRGPLASLRSPFDEAFAAAGQEFGVPPALLSAIGWVETRWQMVEGREEFPGRPAAFGVMALHGDRLEQGAALAGVSLRSAREEPLANIRAGAALLSAHADEAGIDRAQPEAWGRVVARFSGIDLAEGRSAYLRTLDRALRRALVQPGAQAPAARQAPRADCPEPPTGGAPDYSTAVWRPSPNFDARPSDATGVAHMIVVHTCEGAYAGCWSWLVNPVSRVSAHYVLDEEGAEVSQLVREADRGWHIAALYDCDLNRRHECSLNGVQSNHFTIGIEHAGFASQDSFPASQLDASAALVCDVSRDRAVPRDWQHIVAHGRLQPENRIDPGPNWPWVSYLHRVQHHCGEIVVDDDNAFNDSAVATAEAAAGWPATDATVDFYADGYRWASTLEDAADGVVFSFRLDEAGSRTVDARWTSGANRSPSAAYLVIDAAGDTLAMIAVDQTQSGGRWHTLGTWTFPAGWNRVALVRRGAPGAVVVADAVRARQE